MNTDERMKALQAEIKVLATAAERMSISSRLGLSSFNDRNLYESLGYVKEPKYSNYYAQFRRNPFAKAVIVRPVDASWQYDPLIREVREDFEQESPFEIGWTNLVQQFGLFSRFERVDKLATIGTYGVLLLGLKDGKDLAMPVEGTAKELIFVTPYSQENATIKTYESDPTNPRFGLPVLYRISVGSGDKTDKKDVHWSRVIHVVEDNTESEINGNPGLEASLNTLMDLEKVAGGSAEMFWRGGLPGLKATIDPDMDFTAESKEAMVTAMEGYIHSLRRILYGQGVEYDTLAPNVSDPRGQFEILISALAAGTRIPKRILLGSERGELGSSQDEVAWSKHIDKRRTKYCQPQIVDPFIQRMILFGVLPKPTNGYSAFWPSLLEVSEKEKADVSNARSNAIATYTNAIGSDEVMPLDAFYELVMGYDPAQITRIKAMVEEEQQAADDDSDLPEDPDAV